jgi:hypothetical protein
LRRFGRRDFPAAVSARCAFPVLGGSGERASESLSVNPLSTVREGRPLHPIAKTGCDQGGLLREYFPKGTDITGDISYLNTVVDEINGRPRAILQFGTPAEVFAELLLADNPEDNLSSIASTG